MQEQMTLDYEKIIMGIISNSGEAKSTAIEALRYGRKNEFDKALKKLNDAEKALLKAHNVQTQLISNELNGKKIEMNLLMVHAQDHLMNAVTILDLIKELIKILQERDN